MRTTSALEGYNSRLAKKIYKHGNFLKFMDCLIDEEYNTTRNFIAALDGQTMMIFEGPKQDFKIRNNIIEKLTSKLTKKKITLSEFLPQIIQIFNKSDLLQSSEVISSDEEGDDFLNDDYLSEDISLCIICFNNKRDILLQPCNHLKICKDCYGKMAENCRSSILCPYCRTIVQNSVQVFL